MAVPDSGRLVLWLGHRRDGDDGDVGSMVDGVVAVVVAVDIAVGVGVAVVDRW